jgi:hypothetical protein
MAFVVAVSTLGRTVVRPYIALATICGGRRAVAAAGDYVRAKTPLCSVLTLTSIAPTRAAIASVAIVVARSPFDVFKES